MASNLPPPWNCRIIFEGEAYQHWQTLENFYQGFFFTQLDRDLSVAISCGDESFTQTLISAGANVNVCLMEAIRRKDNDMLRKVIELGGNVNTRVAKHATPCLIRAVETENVDGVKLLLDSGAHINAQNSCGLNPLTVAFNQKKYKMVKVLLENGANSNVSEWGKPPHIVQAMLQRDSRMVELFLSSNVDVCLEDSDGNCAMTLACSKRDKNLLKMMIDKGGDVNFINKSGSSLLIDRLQHKDIEMVEFLLRAGADPNKVGTVYSPVDIAIKNNCIRSFNYLFQHGLDVNRYGPNGSPLHFAVTENNIALAEVLISYGADLNKTDIFHPLTPLHLAVSLKRSSLVKLFTANKADVNLKVQLDNNTVTPLFIAVQNYSVNCKTDAEILLILSDANADFESTDADGNTPLIAAIRVRAMGAIKFLLERGANVNAKNQNQMAPLHLTTSEEIVQLLLQYGADVDAFGFFSSSVAWSIKHGCLIANSVKWWLSNDPRLREDNPRYAFTALMIAAAMGNYKTAVALLDGGADVNSVTKDSESALMFSLASECNAVSKLLISRGANVTQQSASGSTPLLVAVGKGNLEVANMILEQKSVNVNDQNVDGVSPLMLAAKLSDSSIVSSLLAKGADVNSADNHHNTALVYSCDSDKSYLSLQCILEAKPNVNIYNLNGFTPLMVATGRGIPDNVSLLLAYGADCNVTTRFGEQRNALSFAMNQSFYYPDNMRCIDILLDAGSEFCTSCEDNVGFHRMVILNRKHFVAKLIKARGYPPIISVNNFYKLLNWPVVGGNMTDSLNHVSPFISALLSGKPELARYFVDHWFLTPLDTNPMLHRYYTQRFLRGGASLNPEAFACMHILREQCSQPWSLAKMSFVAVSAMMGDGPIREERINAFKLPAIIRNMLMFRGM